jgi:hypothetical protein
VNTLPLNTHQVVRLSLRLLLLVLAIAASACTEPNTLDKQWRDYHNRLERVLQRKSTAIEQVNFPRLPRTRDVDLEFHNSGIDLLDFLRLRNCALRDTIAQRNSILGRHADAASRLIFDLRFISQTPACLQTLENEGLAELAAQLRSAAELKRKELPARIFSASFIGPEFRELWHQPTSLSHYPLSGKDPSIAALARWQDWQGQWLNQPQAMAQWSSSVWQDYSNAILSTLGEIRLGNGGSLLAAQLINLKGLTTASDIIQQRIKGRPLCLRPFPVPAAEHFRGALGSVFINQLQKQASAINQHQFALMEMIAETENTLLAAMNTNDLSIPAAFISWQTERDTLLTATKNAQREHVRLAEKLLSQCGLQPGN